MSIVALLVTFDLSVSTSPCAVIEAQWIVEEITLFVGVYDAISTERECAVWSASSRSIRVECTIVAFFGRSLDDTITTAESAVSITSWSIWGITSFIEAAINDTVATKWQSTVGTAAVGSVGVETVITSFTNVHNAITATSPFAICTTNILGWSEDA